MKKIITFLLAVFFVSFGFAYQAPYSLWKFNSILNVSKLTYPKPDKKVVNYGKFQGFASDWFYADEDGNLVFVLEKTEKDSKIRNELREGVNWKDLGWDIQKNTIHHLHAKVKLQPISDLKEYTFLQIHSEEHPLLRMVVEKEKNWETNHIWAVVRITTKDSWKRTQRFDLWPVNNDFTTIDIYAGNWKLIIKRDGKTYVDKDVSYWSEKKNYFKAWIYDSKNSKWPWKVKIAFSELSIDNWSSVSNTNERNDTDENNTSQDNKPSSSVNKPTTKQEFYFAPYVDATLYPFPLLSEISKQTNNYDYVLGFIVSNNKKCEASWGGYYDLQNWPDARIDWQHKYLYDEVNAVKNAWWKIMISFGGAAGTPLFQVCDEDSLLKQYQAVIDKMWTTYLDFDIEGAAIADHQNVDKLIDTLVKLQENNQNKLHIWLTLPVMPEWLTQDGLYLVQQAIKKWLIFDGVNLMTMDYGSSYAGNMANYAIQAVESTKKQIWDNVSIWVTPMIGLNDITTENFTLEDAKTLAEYVKNNKLWRLSYWSLNRDHPCSQASVSNTCSSLNNQTKDYEYLKTFMEYLNLIDTTKETSTVPSHNSTHNSSSSKASSAGMYHSSQKKTVSNRYSSSQSKSSESWKSSYANTNSINSNQDFEKAQQVIDEIVNSAINPWKEKIQSLQFQKLDLDLGKYTRYYKMFENYFYKKKQQILQNPKFQNEDYYLYLKSFNVYTNWVFADIYYKNLQNIKSYLDSFKKVINKLKQVR